MRMRQWILLTGLALPALLAQAAGLGRVEQVLAPAWLVRAGHSQPLTPDMALHDGDRVETGAGARAYLLLGDGGRVKLGASTQFAITAATETTAANGRDENGVYRAAIDIVTGAFRYTTGLLKKLQPRDLSVRVGTTTIGIRGTDIWGRASPDEDMAVLIEGRVELTRGAESVIMSEPLTQYHAPRTGAMQPLGKIDPVALGELARETEIPAGAGASSAQGRYTAMLGSFSTPTEARARYDQVRAAGYAARIRVAAQGGAHRYTVYLRGFASRAEALSVAARLRPDTDPAVRPN